MQLSLAGHLIRARSIGGVETCFELPGFDLCLDIGRCPPGAEKLGTLLLTHGHIDHAAGLPYYVSMRALMKYGRPRIYCPAESRAELWSILESWNRLQADTDRCTLVGVAPGEQLPLSRTTYARVFRAPHRIAAVGYTLFRRVRKLLPELAGLPGPEIAERSRRGLPVHEEVERAEVCFPGDTAIDVIDTEETVRKARVLILECTFMLDKVSPARAQAGGHVHLDQLAARAHLLENEVVLLTHFSRRYSRRDIAAAVDRALPEPLRSRVVLLLDEEHDWGRGEA